MAVNCQCVIPPTHLEVVPKFNDRNRAKQPTGAHLQFSSAQGIEVRRDEEEIRSALDGQEAAPGHVDPDGVPEVLDGSTDRGFELENFFARVKGLLVDDNFQIELVVLDHALHGRQVHPQVVGVEDLDNADVNSG
jgi:hypothetical protein